MQTLTEIHHSIIKKWQERIYEPFRTALFPVLLRNHPDTKLKSLQHIKAKAKISLLTENSLLLHYSEQPGMTEDFFSFQVIHYLFLADSLMSLMLSRRFMDDCLCL